MIAYIWTYKVKPENRMAFAAAYGPNGEWAKFFSQSPDYIRTDMLTDANDPYRFSTIDYFRNADARAQLVDAQKAAYKHIDEKWENATMEETFIGMFVVESNG